MRVKNKKLLVIVGPTASGKTSLAASLARKFDGELISADSRQVYRYMDIGTGKDRPKGVKIWGYDLVSPKEEYSVAQYVRYARDVMRDVWKRGKLPILVGGTGLYVKGVIDGIDTLNVPKDEKLRERLSKKSVNELFEMLKKIDKRRAEGMNESDGKNKRRLVRAIEVAKFGGGKRADRLEADVLMIGIKIDKDELDKRIERRVETRIKAGFDNEIANLLKMGVGWDFQAMQALGYKRDRDTEGWKRDEKQYAKRQMVWFKKDERIKWLRRDKVEGVVKKWYSLSRDAKEN